MPIKRETIIYEAPDHQGGTGPFEGTLITDSDYDSPRPGVMLLPNVLGPKEEDAVIGERLAKLGYAAFIADLYGQGRRARRNDADYMRYMNELNADRGLLKERLHAALARMKAANAVDESAVAATGYCFGGKAVLDLARSGADIRAAISFHGLFDRPDWENQEITARILVCHGWEDPLATSDAVLALTGELTEAGADWQLHAYGHTGHAFTDEMARGDMPPGIGFDEKADRSSWAAMVRLLGEVFG